jgi:hypothetical protein
MPINHKVLLPFRIMSTMKIRKTITKSSFCYCQSNWPLRYFNKMNGVELRNIPARSRNHCCRRNITMHSTCVVELLVTVNCIRILSDAQQCFNGEFMSPATMKRM